MNQLKKLQRKLIHLIKYWGPPVIWGLVIFLFSSRPTNPVTKIYWKDFIVKKSAHIIEYLILTTLIYRGFINEGLPKKRAGIYAIIFGVLYGSTDEYHQSFTPGRIPKVRDIVFDTIGSSLAIYIIWKLLPKAPKKLKNWAKKYQVI